MRNPILPIAFLLVFRCMCFHPTVQAQSNSFEAKAVALVTDRWNEVSTKCGDSYVTDYAGFSILEYKDLTIQFYKSNPLTQADRLNGLEFSGVVKIHWTAYREKAKNSDQWRAWSDGAEVFIGAGRASSSWSVNSPFFEHKAKVSCLIISHRANDLPNEDEQIERNNVALGKPVRLSTNGVENLSDAGQDCNNPAEVTDGKLGGPSKGPCSSDGVVGWQNNDYGKRFEVTVIIDLQKTYRITKIRYNPGSVQRAESWNADLMISPFGTNPTNAGSTFKGAWTEQTGSLTSSSVKITFQKTRNKWNEDWLFIGEIQIIGVPVKGQ